MADEGSGSVVVSAPMALVWSIAVEVEDYPRWAGDVKSVTVTQRDAEGRPAQAKFSVGGFGLTTNYEVAYTYDEPNSFSWRLVSSNEIRHMDGEYRFSDRGDGTVEVTYRLGVDLKIPMIGMLKKRAQKTIIHHALEGLRREAEQRSS